MGLSLKPKSYRRPWFVKIIEIRLENWQDSALLSLLVNSYNSYQYEHSCSPRIQIHTFDNLPFRIEFSSLYLLLKKLYHYPVCGGRTNYTEMLKQYAQ
jgi:hypothetical protein